MLRRSAWRKRYKHPKSSCSLFAAFCIPALLFFGSPVHAEGFYNPRTTFGEIGILDMPSARNAPDGDISLTFSELEDTQRFNFAFQILPWLEGSFRYAHIPHFLGFDNYYDRSFGLKLRLAQESEYVPEISLGMRDILGTGVYSGEYLVATKRIWDIDLTFGVGWGRFAQSEALPNPIAKLLPSFKTRGGTTFTGGTVNFGQLFHGPKIGLFGGAIWRTPIEDLDLLVEYSSDRYKDEQSFGSIKFRIPVNVGLSYRAFNAITISAGWYYGTSYGLTFSMDADPTVPSSPQKFGPDIPRPSIRSPKQQINALTQLLDRNPSLLGSATAAPWVNVQTSEPHPEKLAVTSALLSQADGVRDVDIEGHTLLVDARLSNATPQQCSHYAMIVSSLAPRLSEVALSDLSNPSGHVSICAIAHTPVSAVNSNPSDGTNNTSSFEPQTAAKKIREDVAAQSIDIEALRIEPEMIWLYVANTHYLSETEAVGRIARILMSDAPPQVEVFHIIAVRNGLAQRDFQVSRSALERATEAYGTAGELRDAISLNAPPLSNPVLESAWAESYPRYHWNVGPALQEGFFDPQRPIQIQVLAALGGSVDLLPNLSFEGRGEFNIYNTFDVNRTSDSLLPHVRSDVAEYYRFGSNGIANLDATYRTRVSRDVYFEVKGGYLESMFAGAGSQVLWRPENGRLSFGADLYYVWQRDFDRLFGVQRYHVLTGHVSAYYEAPWYDLNFAVHAGRYLAGDYGATIEVTRRFSTGIEVGAFATFTNVPFAKFGEGSFDKGIIVHIPLEWALPFYSQSSYDLLLRSLSRDGGQRLDNDDSLYHETRPDSYGEVLGHADDIIAP